MGGETPPLPEQEWFCEETLGGDETAESRAGGPRPYGDDVRACDTPKRRLKGVVCELISKD